MKSGYWQIQIKENDRYKTSFTVPFGHYEWNVMPFGLKNAPSEFQNIMNDIFNPFTEFIIVYIDDVLIFSKTNDQHFKHLQYLLHIIEKNGLAISASKMLLFQTKIQFLGHDIYQGTIQRSLVFAGKFPDKIRDKTQLQRFLGCLKSLPCLHLPNPSASMIVETDASDLGYRGILKQKISPHDVEQFSAQTFARWQAILYAFGFEIDFL